MTVTGLIQEIFDEPYFESNGALSDFTLQRGFNTHHVRVITRDWDYLRVVIANKIPLGFDVHKLKNQYASPLNWLILTVGGIESTLEKEKY